MPADSPPLLPYGLPAPPAWLVDEVRRRAVLALNHVLSQEPAATQRLVGVQGRTLRVCWAPLRMTLSVTPAGMFELASDDVPIDLEIEVAQASPLVLVGQMLAGERPAVRIEGDVALAAEINWLIEHVRWDFEEDLARIIGDAAAGQLAGAARQVGARLRDWIGRPSAAKGPSA